uniref:Ribosomal RNA-processing protein 8 n=1 Tax=Ananas comosus var. bracteatus TaxID=296719 RepID=A0A6V7PZQ2_ANACO|nr:unnamed protein product [Ananas comosus var. bracteatus]
METPPQAAARKRKSRRRRPKKRSRNPSSVAAPSSANVKRRKLEAAPSKSSPPSFLDKMRARLSGGHFRMINEKLYTCRFPKDGKGRSLVSSPIVDSCGEEAFDYFKNDPELFNVYHTGYQEQMSHWPEQPVNIIIKWLRSHGSSLTVADFGCGDARIARNVKNKVFSIDLVSNIPSVIACEMSHTPLDSSSIDVAVFCLSLMGTNYPSYLKEANRVLKPCGWLLIAEVRSRLDPNNGGADPDKFSEAVDQLGFSLVSKV